MRNRDLPEEERLDLNSNPAALPEVEMQPAGEAQYSVGQVQPALPEP